MKNTKIHPLLIRINELYRDIFGQGGSNTSEMLNVLNNGKEGTLKGLLETLIVNQDMPVVSKFIQRNSVLINEVEEQLKKENEKINVLDKEHSIPRTICITHNAYETMKSKSLEDIEKELSNSLTSFFNQELSVKINSLGVESEFESSSAKLSVTIKPKESFTYEEVDEETYNEQILF